MGSERMAGHVLDFEAVLVVEGQTQPWSTPRECVEDSDPGLANIALLANSETPIAKACLVDGFGREHSGFAHLKGVISISTLEGARGECLAADPLVIVGVRTERVREGQIVVSRQLPIQLEVRLG